MDGGRSVERGDLPGVAGHGGPVVAVPLLDIAFGVIVIALGIAAVIGPWQSPRRGLASDRLGRLCPLPRAATGEEDQGAYNQDREIDDRLHGGGGIGLSQAGFLRRRG